jgi:hypothetical protein
MYANASMRKLCNSKNVLIFKAESALVHLSASFDQSRRKYESRRRYRILPKTGKIAFKALLLDDSMLIFLAE